MEEILLLFLFTLKTLITMDDKMISLFRELCEFVSTLDEETSDADRQIAIRNFARLLVYCTHDEAIRALDADCQL